MRWLALIVCAASAACAHIPDAFKPDSMVEAERDQATGRQAITEALQTCAAKKFEHGSFQTQVEFATRRYPGVLDEQYPFVRAQGVAGEPVRALVARCNEEAVAFEKEAVAKRQKELDEGRAQWKKFLAELQGERLTIAQLRGYPQRFGGAPDVSHAGFWVFDIAAPIDGSRGPCSITYVFRGDAVASTEAEPAWCASVQAR
jgi:hypothetical protein